MNHVRELRLAAGLTQEELARRAGLTLSGVRQVEREERLDPRVSTVLKIARVLGVTVERLWSTTTPDEQEPAGVRGAESA